MLASRSEGKAPRVDVRRLRQSDRAEMVALLAVDPGYSLFLSGSLDMFGVQSDFMRFWGAFADSRMRAALMMAGRRAAVYAPSGVDYTALARVAGDEGVEFTMGRSDLVEAVVRENSHLQVDQREEHAFAQLAHADFQDAPMPRVPNVQVSRAGMSDAQTLTQLYTGAAGFEGVSGEQVYRTMRGRITTLRTYLAQANGQALAAASTSAETRAAAMVGGVWTAPDWRGQGLSTAVVAALSRDLLGEGRVPYLFYRVDNAPAEHVYMRLGYRVIGGWTVVYFDGRDSA